MKISDNPKVSIIIPVYGQLKYVLACLESIKNAEDSTEIEVIVMDDVSPEPEVQETLKQIDWIHYHRNEVNLRFVKNINAGARLAKGEYLYFLNSDTEVKDRFLEELLKVFENFENVATVGSKFIYPDGTLQEAGSIVYQDGYGYNYGNTQDPKDFKYNFVRDVTYCSAAGLLVKRDIFFDLGMLDEEFTPGYYDDSEFQIRAKSKGFRVMYQPKSEIIHHEGRTHGVDPNKIKGLEKIRYKFFPPRSTGIKKYQEINREKLLKKFQSYMKEHLYTSDVNIDKQCFPRDRKQIFFFEDNLPDFDKSSGSLRFLNLLSILNELGQVTLIPRNMTFNQKYYDAVTQKGIRVLVNSDGKRPDFVSFLKENLKFADVVIFSRPEDGAFFYDIVKDICNDQDLNPKYIYDTVDLHFLRIAMQIEVQDFDEETKEYYKRSYENHRAVETFLMKSVDETWVVSEDEEKYLKESHLSDNVRVVPNIYDPKPTLNKFEDRKDMLFIGAFGHQPNVDAIEFYYNKIIPILEKKDIDLKLKVIGSNPEFLPEYIKDNRYIEILGFVEDPYPYFEDALIAFFPLRFGAGMKGKVTQSLALGLPIVTTDVGAQGHKGAEEIMMVAKDENEMIEKILKLTSDKKLWEEKRTKGIKFLESNFSSKALKKTLASIFKK